jgi:hypothetical protein
MSRSFTASDRSSLLRLASTMSKGSLERKTLLASLKKASIDERTLDQLVDMAVESVGGDPTNSDLTPALMGLRNKWNKAVEGALEKWLKKPGNFAKLNLDSSVFRRVEDEDDIDMVVDALQEHRGGAGYLYYMEMEGHGVGTWDGDWDELFVDEDRTVSELSKYMERAVSREYQNLKDGVDEIAFASVPEDEDGYEDDSYKSNRWAARGALVRLAASMPKGSDERKVILAGIKKAYAPSDWKKASTKAVEMLAMALASRPDIGEKVQKALKGADAGLYRAFSTVFADTINDLNLMYRSAKAQKAADSALDPRKAVRYFDIVFNEGDAEEQAKEEYSPESHELAKRLMDPADKGRSLLKLEDEAYKRAGSILKVRLGNEGHNRGDLVCSFNVSSVKEVAKVWDRIERGMSNDYEMDLDTPFFTAMDFRLYPQGVNGPSYGESEYNDIQDWLDEQEV